MFIMLIIIQYFASIHFEKIDFSRKILSFFIESRNLLIFK